jgi:hypothetical protein
MSTAERRKAAMPDLSLRMPGFLGGHLEDVSTEEMQRRYTAMFEK